MMGSRLELVDLSHLNRAQKRALILRDQLKYLDTHHLDTFIDGIAHPEPPAYKRVNGKILPPLTEVTLKETATSFDVGNVEFREEKAFFRVHLTMEGGNCEMRTSEALPEDDDNLSSVPIQKFLVSMMIPLFQTKYEAIHVRKRTINEVRQYAYSTVQNSPKIRFGEGKSLARLQDGDGERNGSSTDGKNFRKRTLGEPIPKHPANKRKRIGLDRIPDNVKSETFESIPDQIKVDLFNTIIKKAFPSFDNLMMASWNVVSVYMNTGSEDTELHRAMLDLHTVLMEFEASYGKRKVKTELPNKASHQQITSSQAGARSSVSTPENDRVAAGPGGAVDTSHQGSTNDGRQNLAQPRILHLTGNHEPVPTEEETRSARQERVTQNQQSSNRHASQYQGHRNGARNPDATPEQQEEALTRKRNVTASPREQPGVYFGKGNRGDGGPMFYPEEPFAARPPLENRSRLWEHEQRGVVGNGDPRKRQEQYGSSPRTGRPTKPTRREMDTDGHDEHCETDDLFVAEDEDTTDRREMLTQGIPERQARTQPGFLGNSKLGAPKQSQKATGGLAPVAPMMHNRKEANGGH